MSNVQCIMYVGFLNRGTKYLTATVTLTCRSLSSAIWSHYLGGLYGGIGNRLLVDTTPHTPHLYPAGGDAPPLSFTFYYISSAAQLNLRVYRAMATLSPNLFPSYSNLLSSNLSLVPLHCIAKI